MKKNVQMQKLFIKKTKMIKNFIKKTLLVSFFLLFSNLIFSQESKITSTFDATLQIEPQTIAFEAAGGTKPINISTNFPAWENEEISPALLKWLNGEYISNYLKITMYNA